MTSTSPSPSPSLTVGPTSFTTFGTTIINGATQTGVAIGIAYGIVTPGTLGAPILNVTSTSLFASPIGSSSGVSTSAVDTSGATTAGVPSAPSTTASTPFSSSSASSTASASSSNTSSASNSTVSKSNDTTDTTGLKAGIGVAAGIAAIALIALAFVLFRNRRKHYSPAAGSDKEGAYDPTVLALKDKVANLQDDLHSKDANLREAQGALLASGHGVSGVAVLDDKTVHNQFSRLNKDIADWVLTHFKNSRPAASPPGEVTSTLIRTQPNFQFLMQESRTRFLVLRAVVADMLAEAMASGALYGNEDFARMRESVARNGSPAQLSEWRSLTASLLPTSPSQNPAASSLAQRIDYSASSLVHPSGPTDSISTRLSHLTQIVSSAQSLALDLAKQRAEFTFERPNSSMFDPAVMEDVLQEKRAEEMRGKRIQSVVFPAVWRFGGGDGFGGGKVVICKAAVLV